MIGSGLRRGDNSAAPRRGDTETMLARGPRAQYSGDMSLAFDIVGAYFHYSARGSGGMQKYSVSAETYFRVL